MKKLRVKIITVLITLVLIPTMIILPQNEALAAENKDGVNYIFNSEDTITLNEDCQFNLKKNEQLVKKLEKVKHVIVNEQYYYLGTELFPNMETLEFSKATSNIKIPIPDADKLNMPKLKSITVAAENPVYESKDGALYTKSLEKLIFYPHCGNTEVILPEKTKIIGPAAFKDAPITSISISEGLVLIDRQAFANTKLTELSLPKSFLTINEEAFLGTPLTNVKIDTANKQLISIDGAVYTKNLRQLYYWPEEMAVDDLVLPEGLVYLDCSQIKKIDQIKTITIPASLTAIVHTENNQLQKINLSSANKYFKMFDGVMYSSDEKLIRLYPNQNTDTQIEIDPKLEYFPMNLFYADNSTTSITLPKGLKGFEGEPEWQKVRLGGFTQLSEVKLAGKNTNFSTANGILYDNKKTKLLWYPINLNIKEYTIPDTVVSIENDQLIKQNYLEKLSLSKVRYLYDQEKFGNDYEQYYEMPLGKECIKLKEFAVSQKNQYYTVIDGVLFSKDMVELKAYPCAKPDKSYTIPEGVYNAPFGGSNSYLETLIIPSTMNIFALDMTIEMNEKERNGLLNFTALKEIKVDSKNTKFVARDGVLYKKLKQDYLLLIYPVGKTDTEFHIPSDLLTMEGVEYFEKNPYIKKFIIDKNNSYPILKDGYLKFQYTTLKYEFKNIEICKE